MSTKPGRKPRSGRAASLKTITFWDRTTNALKDQGVLIRLGIVTLGLIGFLFAVRGWKPLFPYRVGDRLERGIVARVDFKKVNRIETDRALRQSEAAVAYVFRRNPSRLEAIPARLRTHLGAVAEAGSVASLPPEVRQAFQLNPPSATTGENTESAEKKPLAEPPETRFAKLKTAISGEGVVGERLDQIQKDFESFLEPVRQFGLLNLDDLQGEDVLVDEDEIQLDHAIQILGDTEKDLITATVADAVLVETIKGTGRLGSKWTSFPRLVAMRQLLEVWMTSELPMTLQYAAAETQENRRQARETAGERFDTYDEGSVLIKPGTVLDEELLQLLQLEHEAVGNVTPMSNRIVRGATALLMFGVLAVLFGSYLNRTDAQIAKDPKSLAVFLALCVSTVWLARIVSIDPWRAEVIPLLAAVMLLAIAYDQVLATLCAFVLSVVISLATVATLEHFVVLMVVSVVSVAPLSGVSSRSSLIKTGFLVAAVYFA
ncbi:MAG: hypothetical protein AB8G99_04295, partial [Planctomycetaceae bacterium]